MEEPARYKNQQVEVRGFLYQNLEGGLVLRSEPGLKSCCVNKDSSQIAIRSQEMIEPSLQVKTLTGIFNIEKAGAFVLDNAQEKTEGKFPFWFVGVAVFIVFLSLLSFVLKLTDSFT